MPTFLWSGKTTSGQEEVDRVTAETPEEARRILEGRGWTDLRQHTTEIHDFIKQQAAVASNPDCQPKLTPKEDLAYLQGTAPGLWGNWLKSIRESIGSILIIAVCLAWAVYRRHNLGVIICGGLLVAVEFLFPVLHLWFSQTKNLFHELHAARNWRRWNEVLRCLDKLEHASQSTKIGIGESSMTRYRALALAGLGRLDEAVNGFREAAEKAKMPQWLLHTHLSGIYSVAKQYDRALECYRQAMEEATDKSVVWIDLGVYLVQRFNRPDEAKQLLAQAEAAQLSEQARGWLPYLRGAIAFRKNDFAAVDRNIREALAGFEKHPAKQYYIYEPIILICKGYLAVSSAVLGRKDEARTYFAQSEKYLSAICLDDLLAKYHAEMK